MISRFPKDVPLISDPVVQRFVEDIKARGVSVTLAELNTVLPDVVTSEQIQTFLVTLDALGIEVFD